ncbi:hypothetical protein ACS0TY_012744 [Phlomoides rotata]
MSKKNSIKGRRAWENLRLALLWARKAGVFRTRLVINLNLLQKGIKKLRKLPPREAAAPGALAYGDRQFSFDDSPIIHVKMHRPSSLRFRMPNIPCIKPHVDFDYDFEFDDDEMDNVEERRSFLRGAEEEKPQQEEEVIVDDEGIDLKAEEFIAKFYEQMKLQRQISYLQYN